MCVEVTRPVRVIGVVLLGSPKLRNARVPWFSCWIRSTTGWARVSPTWRCPFGKGEERSGIIKLKLQPGLPSTSTAPTLLLHRKLSLTLTPPTPHHQWQHHSRAHQRLKHGGMAEVPHQSGDLGPPYVCQCSTHGG